MISMFAKVYFDRYVAIYLGRGVNSSSSLFLTFFLLGPYSISTEYNIIQYNKKMQEVAALLLCKLGGKAGSADDIKAVITAAGGEPNDDQIAALCGDVDGKDINELLSAGMEKLKDVPMGGGT